VEAPNTRMGDQAGSGGDPYTMPSYTVANAFAGYRTGRFGVSLNVNNPQVSGLDAPPSEAWNARGRERTRQVTAPSNGLAFGGAGPTLARSAPLCCNAHMDKTIRNLDEQAYRALKARAALTGRTIGEPVNERTSEAMIRWWMTLLAVPFLAPSSVLGQVEMEVVGAWAVALETDTVTDEVRVAGAFNQAEDRIGEPTEDLLMVACAGDEAAVSLLTSSFDPGRAVARVSHRFDGGESKESTWLVIDADDRPSLRFVDLDLLVDFIRQARTSWDLILEVRGRGRDVELWFDLRGTEEVFGRFPCIGGG